MKSYSAVYFQSGGPTSVINSSFFGVIKACFEYKKDNIIDKLYGALYGINGLINDNLVEIDQDLSYYEELNHLNGAILGTCRRRLNNTDTDEVYQKILNTLNKYNIKYIFVNGGNDSMDTADKLNAYFINHNIDKIVVGIPKTIDNDLLYIDHCPGFGSNAKYVVRSVLEIFMDINSYDKGRVTIIEIMGRDTGWLTASTVCCNLFGVGPDLIYVPEAPFNINNFLNDVKRIYEQKQKVLICVSEALKDSDGHYVSVSSHLDTFGHLQFGSVSKYLCDLVDLNLHYNTRNIEFSLTQRAASHLISKLDQTEACNVGYKAVEYAVKNMRGMVTIIRDNINPYKSHLDIVELGTVANGVKLLPKEYLNKAGNYINDSYIDYVRPFLDEEEIKINNPLMFLNNKNKTER